jgi:dimeric dUTPase (all-alpha-NTP-PPase superfamily)
MKWLESTAELQVNYFGGHPAELPPLDRIDWARNMVLGLIVEATEVLAEVKGWKWWDMGDPDVFDRDAYLEELVDVVHFVGALAIAANVTDEEWTAAYARKTEINKQRRRDHHAD